VPHLQGSPPFSLSAGDWQKLGIGAVLSVMGALATYIGVEALPLLC
jgi:energy-coupling factor transporter ATP-binding protein EcfA2